ncbi:hypothetical protein CDAR_228891 [Caerostris darwini]|uniref:Uncharacterized protein n=1 Tax=Caerostris darwini TaxID=1538125 RepID=A0AAV4VML6_9ARAC|nr:hypothetical protein CDAR_228891 [Caerostris darwini]
MNALGGILCKFFIKKAPSGERCCNITVSKNEHGKSATKLFLHKREKVEAYLSTIKKIPPNTECPISQGTFLPRGLITDSAHIKANVNHLRNPINLWPAFKLDHKTTAVTLQTRLLSARGQWGRPFDYPPHSFPHNSLLKSNFRGPENLFGGHLFPTGRLVEGIRCNNVFLHNREKGEAYLSAIKKIPPNTECSISQGTFLPRGLITDSARIKVNANHLRNPINLWPVFKLDHKTATVTPLTRLLSARGSGCAPLTIQPLPIIRC